MSVTTDNRVRMGGNSASQDGYVLQIAELLGDGDRDRFDERHDVAICDDQLGGLPASAFQTCRELGPVEHNRRFVEKFIRPEKRKRSIKRMVEQGRWRAMPPKT